MGIHKNIILMLFLSTFYMQQIPHSCYLYNRIFVLTQKYSLLFNFFREKF